MRLAFLALLSSDVPAAERFWREVMQLPQTYYDESIGYVAFETGNPGVSLSIVSRAVLPMLTGESAQAPGSVTRQMYLSFPVDDVDATYARAVTEGAHSVAVPTDHPEQQSRLAHFTDPDGNLIEIYSPMRSMDAPAE